jgi:hypothetical protein
MSRLGGSRKRNIVRAMTGNVAQWIRCGVTQDAVERIGGTGKRSWGSIGTLMQCDVMMANLFENFDRNAAKHMPPCLLENFVPECTEVMLQSRKGIAYVYLGNASKTFQGRLERKDLRVS